MISITKRLEWDAAHRVLRHESKCSTLHGHRYAALVTVSAEKLDSVGRIVDFGVIKERVGAWIDENWDHTTLMHHQDPLLTILFKEYQLSGKRSPYVFLDEPTAENIALELARHARRLLHGTGVSLTSITIFETPTSSAFYCLPAATPENPEVV